jgi:hypothetical protein
MPSLLTGKKQLVNSEETTKYLTRNNELCYNNNVGKATPPFHVKHRTTTMTPIQKDARPASTFVPPPRTNTNYIGIYQGTGDDYSNAVYMAKCAIGMDLKTARRIAMAQADCDGVKLNKDMMWADGTPVMQVLDKK